MANDEDGTPLGKANTIAWQDTTTMKEDAAKVSVVDAYAKGSGYVEDVDTGNKKNFRERIQSKYDTVKQNIKSQVTYANVKKVGGQIVSNVGNNLKQDVGYLGQQGISTVKNIGLTEKQSIAKYGNLQYPTLFGGQGGYADTVMNDRIPKRKIKRVSGFDNKVNNMDILSNMKKNTTKPVDIFTTTKPKIKKTKKDIIKVKKQSVTFGRDVSEMRDPLSGMMSKPTKVLKQKKTNISNMNNMNDIFKMNMFGKKKKGGLF